MIAYTTNQPDLYAHQTVADASVFSSVSTEMGPGWQFDFLSAHDSIDCVPMSEECGYELKSPIDLTIHYYGDPRFECFSNEFGKTITGYGMTKFEAQKDWEDEFHRHFQELYRMQTFEMAQEQMVLWDKFERLVDLTLYRNEQPVISTQIGKVIQMRPGPTMIEWVNGKCEEVPPKKFIPHEFVSYKAGQYFEATIERDYQTNNIRRIVLSKLLPNFKIHDAKESADFLSSLPTSSDLPDTTF